MRGSIVARNYAEALFQAGERGGELDAYADAFRALDGLLEGDGRVRSFLSTPKVALAAKKDAMRSALGGRVPQRFLNFVLVVLDHRRQDLLATIGREFSALMDAHSGRMQVQVTLAHEPDAGTVADVARELTRILGKQVVPHVRVDGSILGGLIARYEDRVLDLSLRRRLVALRKRLLQASVSAGA